MKTRPKDHGPLRQAKKIIVAVVGTTLLLLGVVMMVTPGPGIPAILGGLAILGTEFIWARRLLKKAKQKLGSAGKMMKDAVSGGKAAEAKPEATPISSASATPASQTSPAPQAMPPTSEPDRLPTAPRGQ
ncbi:MAG: PGPGW domain-containing protein [Planctomycetota bacterium]|nr:PGPGW domain-containing protein [Planctomycetota bacterium]